MHRCGLFYLNIMINFSLKIIKLLSLASVLLALIFICFLFRFYWPDTSLTFYSDLGGNQASLNSKNKPSGEKSMINFLFFGDIMLDRHVKDKIKASGLEYLFLNLAEEEKDFFQG